MSYTTGDNPAIDEGATVGYGYDHFGTPARIGDDATIRSGTIVYADVTIGDGFTTGHNALVREATRMGDDVLVGTGSVIDGTTDVGSNVSIQSGVYVPTDTTIGSNVFLGPHAVLTNDPYPVRKDVDLEGPTIEDGVSIGANATILPGRTVGANAFVAAGAVVTEDVPSETLAVGAPAEHLSLPADLQATNEI